MTAVAALFLTLGTPQASWCQLTEEEEEEPILIPQEDLDELLMWYVDGKFEKVLFKAIRYTEDDEQGKHPMPYLFMAKAYFSIHNSDDAELRETYEVDKMKALKNSLKYANKFIKKDKELEFVHLEQEFMEELRLETIVAAQTEMDNDPPKYTKAKSYYKYLVSLDEEDPGAHLVMGTIYLLLNAKRDADIEWDIARNLLKDQQGRGLTEGQQALLLDAFVLTIEKLDAAGDRAGATSWFPLGDELLGGNREYEAVKRSIGG